MLSREDIMDIKSEVMGERLLKYRANVLSILEASQKELSLDPQMTGWTQSGGEKSDIGGELSLTDLTMLRQRSFITYYKNPHARNIINTYTKFVIGKGTLIDFMEKDEDILKDLVDWWAKFVKLNKWFSFQREFVIRSLRDGEVFVRKFPQRDGPIILRFIDPEKVASNDIKANQGIETDPQDVEKIIAYHIIKPDLGNDIVSAEDIVHLKMNVDRNVKRGRPILEPILPLLTEYDKWRAARMVLSIVRNSVALIREVQGSTTDLSRLRTAQRSSSSSTRETDRAKMLRPGTVITATPGVKYSMLAPKLEARDAATDGRNLKLDMAAGAGLPDVLVTADYAQSNFASTVISQNPAIRSFEEHENIYQEAFSVFVLWHLEDGVSKKIIPQDADMGFTISFPPMLSRDLRQETEAWERMNEKGVVSRRTWALRVGLNPDQERRFIEEEGELPQEPEPTGNGRNDKKTKPAVKRVEDRRPREQVLV